MTGEVSAGSCDTINVRASVLDSALVAARAVSTCSPTS